jgi:hypothetical protein
LAATLVASCAPQFDFEFEAESENLSAKGTIIEMEFDFQDGLTKLSGDVVIENMSSQPQQYSNMRLWLQSGEHVRARAFLDSLASHHIDTGTVEIAPGDRLELAVYWAFPDSEIEKLGSDAFVLKIQSSDE